MGKSKGIKWLVVGLLTLALLIGGGCNVNTAPIIYSLTPSVTSLGPGDSCTIACSASDANGDTLSYAWSVSGGAITGTGSTVTWTAPTTEGTYTITVTVSDGRGGDASESTTISVANTPPSITSLTPSTTSVMPGDSCTIGCVASDADGDTLSYAWSATGGSTSGMGSTITWTAPTAEGTYTITVTVSDGKGGVTSESCTITVETMFGSIDINSDPQGAAIFIDGVDTGNITPWTASNLVPGLHTVRLEYPLYNNLEGQVTVIADETAYINWPLTHATIVNITIQLDDTNGQDSYVRDDLPTLNYGSDNHIAAGSSDIGDIARAYIQFDLSGLPEGAVITNAVLALSYYATTTPPMPAYIGAYKVLESWDESTITWNDQPNVFTSPENFWVVPDLPSGLVYWTITDLVQSWCDDSTQNFGVMLGATNVNDKEGWKYFRSSETTTPPDTHPQLMITYYDPTP